jgi:hypothetical protein
VKDYRYKISISTRIWEGETCLGILVANIPIGRRLVVMDMADQPEGTMVVSPMDWSYADRGVPPPPGPPRFLAFLDRSYPESGLEPIWVDPARYPRLEGFARNPTAIAATDRFREGAVLSYRRVGDTPLVAILRHPYPWPLRWLFDARLRRLAVPIVGLAACVAAIVLVRRGAFRLRFSFPKGGLS